MKNFREAPCQNQNIGKCASRQYQQQVSERFGDVFTFVAPVVSIPSPYCHDVRRRRGRRTQIPSAKARRIRVGRRKRERGWAFQQQGAKNRRQQQVWSCTIFFCSHFSKLLLVSMCHCLLITSRTAARSYNAFLCSCSSCREDVFIILAPIINHNKNSGDYF